MKAGLSGRAVAPTPRACFLVAAVLVGTGCAGSVPPVQDRPVPAVETEHRHGDSADRSEAREPTTPPADRSAEAAPTTGGSTHVVSPGDTLWSIARRYGSTVQEIVSLNNLPDADQLVVGQELTLPDRIPAGEWLWPVPGGTLLSHFGAPRRTHRHQGVDIGAERGNPVVAMRSGKVIYSGSGMSGYGKTIILDHGGGITSLYAHNSSLLVRRGVQVDSGQLIARIGRSGNASGEHCHLEIRRDEVAIDPMIFLSTVSMVGGTR